jgi:hypothetical protein
MATVNRAALEEHIRELREEVSGAGLSVSADARLTAHSALVQAEAMVVLADAVTSAASTAVADVTGPLVSAMARLGRQ